MRSEFVGPLAKPPIANLTAVTATTETILWNVSRYTPIAANDAQAGDIYEFKAGGIMSFAATGSLTLTPRIGLTVAAGITLGASIAKVTPGATTNAAWYMEGSLIIRTVGDPGVNSTAILTGHFQTQGVGTLANEFNLTFGGTSATFDASIATGIVMGWTLSVAGTVTPQYAYIKKVN